MFKWKKKDQQNILRLHFRVDVAALECWLEKGMVEDIPISTKPSFGPGSYLFEYEILVLPVGKNRDWYYHKNTGDYSHSINAIIELDKYFSPRNEKYFEEFSPDLEINMWRGQLSIAFRRKLILMAPLVEGLEIMKTGTTSLPTFNSQKKSIEVPTAFSDSQEPIEFMTVHQSIDPYGVMYSNALVSFTMDTPTGPTVMRSNDKSNNQFEP